MSIPATLQDLLAQVRAQAAAKKAAPRKSTVLMAAAEAERRWCEVYVPQHYLARYWRSTCRCCGLVSSGLEGLYEVRKHPRLSDQVTRRLAAISPESMNPLLPRTVQVSEQSTPTCANCIEDFGFDPYAYSAIVQEPSDAAPEESDPEAEGSPEPVADDLREGDDPDSQPQLPERLLDRSPFRLDRASLGLLHSAPGGAE